MKAAASTPNPAQRLFNIALGKSGPRAEIEDVDVSVGLNRALAHARSRSAKLRTRAHEDIAFALQAIEAALFAIDEIRGLLEEAGEVVEAARAAPDLGGRALLAERYDDLRLAVDEIAGSAEFEGVSLLSEDARSLEVELGRKARYLVAPLRLAVSAKGLHLPPPEDAFAETEEIDRVAEKIAAGQKRVSRATETYCRDAQVLGARLVAGAVDGEEAT
ncbi:MAG: hypothetical protein AAGL49_04560 [Pseudomonadota bacterium]